MTFRQKLRQSQSTQAQSRRGRSQSGFVLPIGIAMIAVILAFATGMFIYLRSLTLTATLKGITNTILESATLDICATTQCWDGVDDLVQKIAGKYTIPSLLGAQKKLILDIQGSASDKWTPTDWPNLSLDMPSIIYRPPSAQDLDGLEIIFERGNWAPGRDADSPSNGFIAFETGSGGPYLNAFPALSPLIAFNAVRIKVKYEPTGSGLPILGNLWAIEFTAIGVVDNFAGVPTAPFALPVCAVTDTNGEFDLDNAFAIDRFFTRSDRFCATRNCSADPLPGYPFTAEYSNRDQDAVRPPLGYFGVNQACDPSAGAVFDSRFGCDSGTNRVASATHHLWALRGSVDLNENRLITGKHFGFIGMVGSTAATELSELFPAPFPTAVGVSVPSSHEESMVDAGVDGIFNVLPEGLSVVASGYGSSASSHSAISSSSSSSAPSAMTNIEDRIFNRLILGQPNEAALDFEISDSLLSQKQHFFSLDTATSVDRDSFSPLMAEWESSICSIAAPPADCGDNPFTGPAQQCGVNTNLCFSNGVCRSRLYVNSLLSPGTEDYWGRLITPSFEVYGSTVPPCDTGTCLSSEGDFQLSQKLSWPPAALFNVPVVTWENSTRCAAGSIANDPYLPDSDSETIIVGYLPVAIFDVGVGDETELSSSGSPTVATTPNPYPFFFEDLANCNVVRGRVLDGGFRRKQGQQVLPIVAANSFDGFQSRIIFSE